MADATTTDVPPWEIYSQPQKPWEMFSPSKPAVTPLQLKPFNAATFQQPEGSTGITLAPQNVPDLNPEPYQATRDIARQRATAMATTGAATTAGITPENVQQLSDYVRSQVPHPLKPTYTAVTAVPTAIAKTAAGFYDWITSPLGLAQTGLAALPPTRIPAAISFFQQSAAGAGKSANDTIDAWKKGDIQGVVDGVVNTLVNAGTAFLIGKGTATPAAKPELIPPLLSSETIKPQMEVQNATRTQQQQESVPAQRQGNDAQRPSPETGGGGSVFGTAPVEVNKAPEAETLHGSAPVSGAGSPQGNGTEVLTLPQVAELSPDDFVKWTQTRDKGLTGEAWRVGRAVKSPDEVAQLQALAEQTRGKMKTLQAAGDFKGAMGEAQKIQFFNEAYGAATGTGSAGLHLRTNVPNYKPPFPKKESEPPKPPEPVPVKPPEPTPVAASQKNNALNPPEHDDLNWREVTKKESDAIVKSKAGQKITSKILGNKTGAYGKDEIFYANGKPFLKTSVDSARQKGRVLKFIEPSESKPSMSGPGSPSITKTEEEPPEMVGMGAAVPSEFERSPNTPTGIKNATVDQERVKRGLAPAIQPARRAFGQVWDEAMAEVDRDPEVTDRLVDSLREHPRALTDREDALLLHHQITIQNDYGKLTRDLAQAYDDAKEFPNRNDAVQELKPRVAALSDRLLDLYDIGKKVGTQTGRGLNARKLMAYEDYSLAQMEVTKRAANDGKPLTESQQAEIQQLHDQIQKTQRAYDDYVASTKQKISDLEAQRAIDEAFRKANPPIEPHIRVIANKIIGSMESAASAAMNRIKARRAEGRLTAGLDPADLADHAIYGALKIAKGVTEFASWSADMVKEFGDYIKPHLQDIFKASNDKFEENFAKAGKAKATAKRAAKTPEQYQSYLADKITSRLKAGKKNEITPMVQRLARVLVERGIKGRDALIDAVHGILQQADPEITRREAMDAISGYGDFKPITKDDISVELRDLKGQMQQVAKLEDMQAGEPPLKTGVERRIPSKEESRLIKLVNDAKRKFQIPITDPNTQLRSSLDELKKRMANRTEELQQKLEDGDFATKPRPQPIKLDAEGLRLKAANERAKLAFQRGLQLDRLKNRTTLEKMQDTFVKWRRGFLLSSPITLAKLTAAAIQRMAITPIEEAIGGVYSKALPKVASKAAREGGFNSKAEARALTDGIMKGMQDAWDVLKTGQSELDVLYGQGREGYVRESYKLPSSVIDFFGHIHGALKAPAKRAEFARAFEKRAANAIAGGVDVSDPMVQTRLAVDAYKDANRSIFLQDNRVVSMYKRGLSALEQPDKATGRVPIGSKAGATALRIALPIVRVPTNIVAETFQYALGTVTGSARLAAAMSRGIENLKPEEADLIMRELKKGTLGAAVMLWGYFNPQLVGGYYQQGQKRKPDDVKYGSVRIAGYNIPSFLLHSPLLETAQLGATVRRVADSKLHKRDSERQGITAGLLAGGLGLTEEIPFVNDTLQLTKMFNPYERGQFFGEYAKSLVVPQLLQFIANETDKDAQGNVIKRKPQGMWQNIETGIPGLRKNITGHSAGDLFKLSPNDFQQSTTNVLSE